MCDTPIGSTLVISCTYKSCGVVIEDRKVLVDLMVLDMHNFDVILRMDCLSRYHAFYWLFENKVNFHIPGQLEFSFVGGLKQTPPIVIFALQVKNMLRHECNGYLAMVQDT